MHWIVENPTHPPTLLATSSYSYAPFVIMATAGLAFNNHVIPLISKFTNNKDHSYITLSHTVSLLVQD